MFLKKKEKNTIIKEQLTPSLRDSIMDDLNCCNVSGIDVSESKVYFAKNELLKMFGLVNEIYSKIIIKLTSIRNIDCLSLNEWHNEYENFSKNALHTFSEETKYNALMTSNGVDCFNDIITQNNSLVSKLSYLISEKLSKNVYNPVAGNVFLVHGHDLDIRNYIAEKLKMNGFHPIILDREVSSGTTVLEKFVKFANSSSKAIIFMTKDDKICKKDTEYYQARPNVFLELGYFFALMDKKDIIIVKEKEAVIPSDINGFIYESYEENMNQDDLFNRILTILNR